MSDAYTQWKRREQQEQRELEKLPVCACCGEHIQSEHCYEIEGDLFCMECLDLHFRKNTEDYVDVY